MVITTLHKVFFLLIPYLLYVPKVPDLNHADIIPRVIEKTGGWSKLEQTKYDLPEPADGDPMFKVLRKVVRPHVMGVATK